MYRIEVLGQETLDKDWVRHVAVGKLGGKAAWASSLFVPVTPNNVLGPAFFRMVIIWELYASAFIIRGRKFKNQAPLHTSCSHVEESVSSQVLVYLNQSTPLQFSQNLHQPNEINTSAAVVAV